MSTHKDERGILVWKKLDESTDTQINLVATYDAYDTGINYEMIFDDGNITALHKLFAFDATLIFDIIKLVPMLSVDNKCVVAKYYTEVAQRKCDIVITLPRKECEGENETTRQNKILLRQVATLADRISALETQINKLALCVMNCSYNESVGNLSNLCDIIGTNNIIWDGMPLLESIPIKEPDIKRGGFMNSDRYWLFAEHTRSLLILKHPSTNINIICSDGRPFIVRIIDQKDYYIDKITQNFLFIKEHKKIDILLQSKTGETALSVCRKKAIENNNDFPRGTLESWNKLRRIIVAMEKEQQKIPQDVDDDSDDVAYVRPVSDSD